MSVWQNFKDTDHEFEKKFFGTIFLMALLIGVFFLIEKVFDYIPDVKFFLFTNCNLFLYFIIGLVVFVILTEIIYYRTLDFIEAETKVTKKALIINVVIWTFYWSTWSVFCAWLTLNNNLLTFRVKSIIIGLVIVPGLVAFGISRSIRQKQINDEEKSKLSLGDNYYKSDPYTLFLDKKYYSGYYGLICLPVYLISLIIGHFI